MDTGTEKPPRREFYSLRKRKTTNSKTSEDKGPIASGDLVYVATPGGEAPATSSSARALIRAVLKWGAQIPCSTEQNAVPPTNFKNFANVTMPGGTTFKPGSLVEVAPSTARAAGAAASAPVVLVVLGVGQVQDTDSSQSRSPRACIFVWLPGSSVVYVGTLRSVQLKLVDPAAAVSSAAPVVEAPDPDAVTKSFHSYLDGLKNNKVPRPLQWDKISSLVRSKPTKAQKQKKKKGASDVATGKRQKAASGISTGKDGKGSTGMRKGGKGGKGGKGKGDEGQTEIMRLAELNEMQVNVHCSI